MTAVTSNNTPDTVNNAPEASNTPAASLAKKKKNYCGARFRSNIRSNKKQLIISSVFSLIGLPLISVFGLINEYYGSKETIRYDDFEQYSRIAETCSAFYTVGAIAIVVSLLLGFFVSNAHFPYLYKKHVVDMNYSLPLNNRQRFTMDYLSGLTVYMAPAIAAICLSFAILGIGSFIIDSAEIRELLPPLLKVSLAVLVGMLQFYTLSVLIINFCGSHFEASFSVIIMNCMIPAVITLVWIAVVEQCNLGLVSDGIFMSRIFTCTSPIGGAAFVYNYVPELTVWDGMYDSFSSLYIKWIVGSLFFTALYGIAAFLLYRKRKAEDVSKPYVYKSFFYILMTMAVFCIMSLFVSMDGVIGAGIFICAIGWFIMEIITRRGFKRFWTAPIGFVASVSAVLLICYSCKITDGFGISKYVPSPAGIESVELSGDIMEGNYISIRFKDRDVIKAVTELQQCVIDDYFEGTDRPMLTDQKRNMITAMDVTMKYYSYTGSVTVRDYSIPVDRTADLVKAVLLSDEYAESVREDIVGNGLARDSNSITVGNKLREVTHYYVTDNTVVALADAMKKDLMAMTEEELLEGNVAGYVLEYFILDSFTNTLDLLDYIEADIPDVFRTEHSGANTSSGYVFDPVICAEIYTNVYNYKGKSRPSCQPHIAESATIVTARNLTAFDLEEFVSYEQRAALAERCTPIIIGENPLAIVVFNSKIAFIKDTPENRAFVEEFKSNPDYSRSNGGTVVGDWNRFPLTIGTVDESGNAVID